MPQPRRNRALTDACVSNLRCQSRKVIVSDEKNALRGPNGVLLVIVIAWVTCVADEKKGDHYYTHPLLLVKPLHADL